VSPVLRRPRVVLVLAVALVLLTAAVAAGAWPVSLDRRLAAAVLGTDPQLLRLAAGVTRLATPQVSVALTVAAAAWLSRRERDPAALRTVAVPLVALVVGVVGGKVLLHRAGPSGRPLHHLLGYYPSGHTATALVCAGLLTRLVVHRSPTWRARLVVAATAWTALVATSLVLHRYHWLSDVVAGALLGSLVLLSTERVSLPAPPEPARTAPRAG
jgi:undecaprenyl-diphosphatase